MGRPRKPAEEVVKTISINLKQGTIDEIAKEGKPKNIIEKLINDKYGKK